MNYNEATYVVSGTDLRGGIDQVEGVNLFVPDDTQYASIPIATLTALGHTLAVYEEPLPAVFVAVSFYDVGTIREVWEFTGPEAYVTGVNRRYTRAEAIESLKDSAGYKIVWTQD